MLAARRKDGKRIYAARRNNEDAHGGLNVKAVKHGMIFLPGRSCTCFFDGPVKSTGVCLVLMGQSLVC